MGTFLVYFFVSWLFPLLLFGFIIPWVVIVGLPLLLFFPLPAMIYALYRGMKAATTPAHTFAVNEPMIQRLHLITDVSRTIEFSPNVVPLPLPPITKRRSQGRQNQIPPLTSLPPPADTGSGPSSHVTA